jgi:hypothetical protein
MITRGDGIRVDWSAGHSLPAFHTNWRSVVAFSQEKFPKLGEVLQNRDSFFTFSQYTIPM